MQILRLSKTELLKKGLCFTYKRPSFENILSLRRKSTDYRPGNKKSGTSDTGSLVNLDQ
jgi:hypothetical protein